MLSTLLACPIDTSKILTSTEASSLRSGTLRNGNCGLKTLPSGRVATDGGNFERMGVRTLVFGPGSIDVAHKADEYVPVDELHRAVDVVEEVVARRCRLV